MRNEWVKLACKLANNTHANMAEDKSVRQNRLLLNDHTNLSNTPGKHPLLPIAGILVISSGKTANTFRPVGWGGGSVGSVDPPRSSELVPLAIKIIYS